MEITTENIAWAPQGWQCPVCKRVYSPTTPMCYYCGNKEATGSALNIIDPASWNYRVAMEHKEIGGPLDPPKGHEP